MMRQGLYVYCSKIEFIYILLWPADSIRYLFLWLNMNHTEIIKITIENMKVSHNVLMIIWTVIYLFDMMNLF